MDTPDIQFEGVTKRFGEVVAVDDVSLSIDRGAFFSFLGPSGCGKTTSLRLIAGFEAPIAGSLELAGDVVADGRHFVPPERRGVGMVFQDYALFPHMTVLENVEYGLRGFEGKRQLALDALATTGLSALGERRVHELSGGEQQRVGIARAVVNKPKILLADEPTGNLDPELSAEIMHLFEQFNQVGVTVLIASHDLGLIARLPYRMMTLRSGGLVTGIGESLSGR